MNKLIATWITLTLAAVPLAACGSSADSGGETPAPPAREEARTLPIPGQDLPTGHPPLDGSATSTRLTWNAPGSWEVETPQSNMRLAQYRVPGPAGDGECVVYYFGPGQGGDPMANARRWAGQFSLPGGGSAEDSLQVTELDSTTVPVQLVEVHGTYDGGMTMTAAPPEKKEGYMLLGGIAQGPDAPWFFKLTGPEKTVQAQRDAFVAMMKSIRPEE